MTEKTETVVRLEDMGRCVNCMSLAELRLGQGSFILCEPCYKREYTSHDFVRLELPDKISAECNQCGKRFKVPLIEFPAENPTRFFCSNWCSYNYYVEAEDEG